MPVFQYEVADRKGWVSRGTAEATEQAELITRFRERGQIVLSLRPARSGAVVGGGFSAAVLAGNLRQSYKRMATGVNLGTVLLFTGQLAAMLGGGLHLVRILTALAAESTHKVFTKVLESVRDDITAGGTFADALAHHPHVFNTLYVSILRAAGPSGSLPVVLDPLIRKGILARTCRTLSVLLNAGIPLIEAMETVAKVSGNAIIEDALTKATQRMRDGGTIADTLRETGEFPGMVTQLVATGEESGTLPTMLGRAATYYEQQDDQVVSALSSL